MIVQLTVGVLVEKDVLQGVQFLFFPIFSYFFEPIPIFSYFLTKTSYFPIFLAGEAKICNKIENGIIVVCVFE